MRRFGVRSYPIYENKVVIPVPIDLMWWELGVWMALVRAKVRAHESSRDGDVADAWVEIHFECGTGKLAGEPILLPVPCWCVRSLHGGV